MVEKKVSMVEQMVAEKMERMVKEMVEEKIEEMAEKMVVKVHPTTDTDRVSSHKCCSAALQYQEP